MLQSIYHSALEKKKKQLNELSCHTCLHNRVMTSEVAFVGNNVSTDLSIMVLQWKGSILQESCSFLTSGKY